MHKLIHDQFSTFNIKRSSDRRRSLANEKAEAQRRLYKSEVYSSKNELLNSLQINTNCDKNTKMKQKKLFDMVCEPYKLFFYFEVINLFFKNFIRLNN